MKKISAKPFERVLLIKLNLVATGVFLLAGSASGATVRYVWQDGLSPAPPYTNWATAATNIQDAVDAAAAGDEIVVTNGTYTTGGRAVVGTMTNRVVVDKPLALRSVNGPEFTIIQGAKAPGGGNGDGAIRCVYLADGGRLSGFTLTNGATRLETSDETRDRDASGGGLWCASTNGFLTNCVLVGNSADWQGGGALQGALSFCTLSSNRAYYGGGALGSTLDNCTLTNNSAGFGGGGAAGCLLRNCVLAGNSAGFPALFSFFEGSGGGAFYSTLRNCVLTANRADFGGGAYEGALYNCTLTDNSAEMAGGGACGDSATASPCLLYNCLVYFNRAPLDANSFLSELEHSCSIPLPPGPGNLDADPQLATITRVSSASPCVGAGNSAYALGVDIDGEAWANPPAIGADQPGPTTGPISLGIEADATRFAPGYTISLKAHIEGSVSKSQWDLGDGTLLTNQPFVSHAWAAPGAYSIRLTGYNDSHPEGISATLQVAVQEPEHYYVNSANPSPQFPYRTWETAANSIQEAIGAGSLAGRVVLVTDGVYRTDEVPIDVGGIIKGFDGFSRVALTNRVVVQSVNGPSVTVIEGATDNVRCAYVGDGSVLSGFTLNQGFVNGSGGGALCQPLGVLSNCVLTGNSAAFGGGARGGTLYWCTLRGNSASSGFAWGGGASDTILYNCTLTGNSTSGDGGGASFSTLRNCVIYNNFAYDGGGAGPCTLDNCTVTGNSASGWGGGVAGYATLKNCIVYFNTAPRGANWCSDCGYIVIIGNSCTTPLPPATGNIDADPRFVDAAADDYRLRPDSSCINAGNNSIASGPTDLDGNPRIVSGTVDIGAYEYQGAGSVVSYAWLHQYGLPTDGSADFKDLDGDGLNNWQEWRCGTCPTNALSVLRLLAAAPAGTNVTVSWQSVAGVNYFLERSTDLTSPPIFTPLATNLLGQAGTTTYTDTNAAAAPRLFYRVGVP